MILNVANSSFEDDFLDKVSEYKTVKILFGKLASDPIGGGCETSLLPDISKTMLADYVNKAHKKGIEFNYVINAPFLDNAEFMHEGRKEINELLDFLNSLNLESVTVANPFLVMYIKKNFKNLRIKASANFLIDSVDKAYKVKEMGVDILVLDPLLVNRDFETLKKIRQEIGEEIEILVNNNCIMNCPLLSYHQCYLGASSRSNAIGGNKDFCYENCSLLRISDPFYYLKGDWIRPEDIHYYEEIGYDRFKLTDRCAPKEVMYKRIEAYTNREYNGNLLDLIQHYYYRDEIEGNIYRENIYIDNKALDGFWDKFVKGECTGRNCFANCNYCRKFAEKSVSVKKEFREKWVKEKEHNIIAMTHTATAGCVRR